MVGRHGGTKTVPYRLAKPKRFVVGAAALLSILEDEFIDSVRIGIVRFVLRLTPKL